MSAKLLTELSGCTVSFRTKLMLIFMLTMLASVFVSAYGVTHYTRAAFEEMDAQRTRSAGGAISERIRAAR